MFGDRSRRDFLRTAGAATLSAMAGGSSRLLAAGKVEPTADTLILLWMAGGMAQTETFDPKRYTPFETGLESARVLSTFPDIPTKVDGVRLSKGLERIASVMDRCTLVRGYQAGDLGFILHSRHQFHCHTSALGSARSSARRTRTCRLLLMSGSRLRLAPRAIR
jgi:hypothetical protein